jgi:hypothetical protein
MIAIALTTQAGGSGFSLPAKPDGTLNYDLAIPMMLGHYFPPGLLGLGLTALMASFMSGMAGNVTAFNTVWTYDIYQAYIKRGASDQHYLWMGRMATIFGIALSVAVAYATTAFNNIMDMLQLVFAFVNAPLFATFLLGCSGGAPRPWRLHRSRGRHLAAACTTACRCRAGRWRASRAGGSAPRCTPTRAKWPRTSGPPSGPGPFASW